VGDGERVGLHHRLALVAIVVFLFALVATTPVSVQSVLQALVQGPSTPVFAIGSEAEPSAPDYADLHVELTAFDDTRETATLRVSGHRVCRPACAGREEVAFFALREDEAGARGVPPSATVALPEGGGTVAQTIQLPVRGHLVRYPFDRHELLLGIALRRVGPDGTGRWLPPAEARERLRLTLQEAVPQVEMAAPVAVDAAPLGTGRDPASYAHVVSLTLTRAVALQTLTVLLVALIAAAAAYAAFLRALDEILLSAGSLIVGIWGIRSILVPSAISGRTAVDVVLSVVIIVLLAAVTVRVLLSLWQRNSLWPATRRPPEAAPALPAEPEPPPPADAAASEEGDRRRPV
jgi:hypothetical protein